MISIGPDVRWLCWLRCAYAGGALLALVAVSGGASACEMPVVKEQIDTILDKDAKLGAEFRKEVKEGADSIAALERLVSPQMQQKIDICRFHVAEYLTKRGFPPPH